MKEGECPYCGPDGTAYHGDSQTVCKHCGGSHEVPPKPAPVQVQEAQKAESQSAEELAIKILADLYRCTRVWSAWGYGTMGQDDFHLAEEDDNIVSDAIALIESRDADQRQAGREAERADILAYCKEAGHLEVAKSLEEYNEKQEALADLDKGRKG